MKRAVLLTAFLVLASACCVHMVPVFFLLGRHDWQMPARVAANYFDTIDAPCKRLVWFEQSAYYPPFEG